MRLTVADSNAQGTENRLFSDVLQIVTQLFLEKLLKRFLSDFEELTCSGLSIFLRSGMLFEEVQTVVIGLAKQRVLPRWW
jgi:hypothetical protein